MTAGAVPRAARGADAATGPSCAWASIPDPTPCRAGFPATLAGVERVRAAHRRGGPPVRRRRQAQPRVLRGVRLGGVAALERLRALVPADVPFVADAKRGDIGIDCRAPGGGPVRRPRRGRGDRQPVPRRGGDRAAARARRPVRLRPVPDVQPGRGRAPGPRRRGGRGHGLARPSRCMPASPGARGAGARAGRSGSSSAPRRPRSSAAIRSIAPGPRVPRPRRRAPRAATIEPVLAAVPRPRRPPAGGPAAGCSSTSRGASPRRPSATPDGGPATPASVSRRPPRVGRRLPVLP